MSASTSNTRDEQNLHENLLPFSVPHPADSSKVVDWDNGAFYLDGRRVRVLAYQVAPSGWTDQLTQLHEQTGGSDHFIDLASRNYACSEVERCITRLASTVLEIGCSSGFLLRDLLTRLPAHRVFGADYTYDTLEHLGKRLPNVPLLQFDLTQCPLPDAFVDVAVLLNVLEHIDDHEAAVAHLFRIIKPGGAVVIEVPAGPSLYDVYDRVLMHRRRYAMSQLVKLLDRCGFAIERRSHLGFILYPAFYLTKRLYQFRYPTGAAVDEQQLVADMIKATRNTSRAMNLVMVVENILRPALYFPFGIRCLVTGRKRPS
jgi:SAM-dependent methyltransferase